MTDYRMFYDSKYLCAFHLQEKDHVVEIVKVEQGVLVNPHEKTKTKKPLVYFKGKGLPLGLNKTNGKAIATMYGSNTANWIGKTITIYPTVTSVGGTETACIRVRPQIPSSKAVDLPAPPPLPSDVDPDTGEVRS